MKYILPLLFIFFSCAPDKLLVDKSDVTGIPGGSSVVIADSNVSADSLFTFISQSLGKSKWIVRSSREAMQISCDPRMVRGNIYLKPHIVIEPTDNGSRALYRGIWSTAPMDQDKIDLVLTTVLNSKKKITWTGYKTKPGLAYQNLILLAKKVPAAKISHSK